MKKSGTLHQTSKADLRHKNNAEVENETVTTEPVRGSLVLFVFKITMILVFTNLIYMTLNYVLLQAFFLNHDLPFNLHDRTPYILTILHIATTALQIWGISTVSFHWIGKSYQVTKKHLVQREGIINCIEKIYDLNNVRSVTINQSFLGRWFRFGDILIETSAPGLYEEKISLTGVANPQRFADRIQHCF